MMDDHATDHARAIYRSAAEVMACDAQGRQPVILEIGDCHFGIAPLRLVTLLGSCVAVTFWHPTRRLGGMCHCQLSTRDRPPDVPLDGRFVDEAFELFDRQLRQWGRPASEFVAKLFGGGRMFAASSDVLEVGQRNIDAAETLLAVRQIPVLARHVGGDGRRKLVFDLTSGEVWVQYRQGA